MPTTTTFEIELTRHNVTPSQFLSYVRRNVDKKGGYMLRGDLDLAYFAAGDDLNFDIYHSEPEFNGLHEKSVSEPYKMQTYNGYANGAVYNEICEFEFDDDKTGHGYYYLVNIIATEEPEESATNVDVVDAIRAEVDTRTERSAWSKGVTAYAHDLVDTLDEAIAGGYFDVDDLGAPKLLERALLNGAEDWSQYSWGGCSLCYDGQIAERLCTPSELKKTRNGERRPNCREEWLDTQARALYQASNRVKRAVRAVLEKEAL